MRTKNLLLIVSFFLSQSTLFAQQNKIYGLNFVNSELRFTTMDIASGQVSILSSEAISPDIFQAGVADFNPINKHYYYLRGIGDAQQIMTVDVFSGALISSPNMTVDASAAENMVSAITNIAYNWLDGEIYGVNHQYDGNTLLRLAKVNPVTGEVDLISDQPISTTPFVTANSDIDPVNRRYFYATSDRIYTVDLDSGNAIYSPAINYPMSGNQFAVNLTYDWQNDIIYCLHFLSIPNTDPFSDPFTSELRIATIDPETGEMTLLSDDVISNDGFSIGDCDIDPTGNRYMYIRQDSLYTVNLQDGTLMSKTSITNLNNAIAPIISMCFDDLDANPGDIIMDMGETMEMVEGEEIILDAWVGDEAEYVWSDGSTISSIIVTEPGTYSVEITRDAFKILGEIRVEANTVSNSNLENQFSVSVFPNPAVDFLQVDLGNLNSINGTLTLINTNGQELIQQEINSNIATVDVSRINSGIYFLRIESSDRVVSKKVVLR